MRNCNFSPDPKIFITPKATEAARSIVRFLEDAGCSAFGWTPCTYQMITKRTGIKSSLAGATLLRLQWQGVISIAVLPLPKGQGSRRICARWTPEFAAWKKQEGFGPELDAGKEV